MINTTAMLIEQMKRYSNPSAKIARMVKNKELIPITKGLYETDSTVQGHCLAGVIYGPSYLSFEFALAWHNLIPEAVYTFTSATCGKNRKKQYNTPFGVFTYRDVPTSVFPYGTRLYEENGYAYIIASAEKAICDCLYKCSPVNNKKELRQLLFEDMRIDDTDFRNTDLDSMSELAGLYHNSNHRLLISLIKEIK